LGQGNGHTPMGKLPTPVERGREGILGRGQVLAEGKGVPIPSKFKQGSGS